MSKKRLQYLVGAALLLSVSVGAAFLSPAIRSSAHKESAPIPAPTIHDTDVSSPFSRLIAENLVPELKKPFDYFKTIIEIDQKLSDRSDSKASSEERRRLLAQKAVLQKRIALSPAVEDPRRGVAAEYYCDVLANERDLEGLQEFEALLKESPWTEVSGKKPYTFAYITLARIGQAAAEEDKAALEALTADLETIAQNGVTNVAVAGRLSKYIDPFDRVDQELGNQAKAKALAGFQKAGSTVLYPELQESYRAFQTTLPENDPLKFAPETLDVPMGENQEFYRLRIGRLNETLTQIPENSERADYQDIKARVVQSLGTARAAILVLSEADEEIPSIIHVTNVFDHFHELARLGDEERLSLFAYNDGSKNQDLASRFLFKVRLERAAAQKDEAAFDRLTQEALSYMETTANDPGVIYRINAVFETAQDKIPPERLAQFKKDCQERLARSSYPNIRRIGRLDVLAD